MGRGWGVGVVEAPGLHRKARSSLEGEGGAGSGSYNFSGTNSNDNKIITIQKCHGLTRVLNECHR
uniref:Uncharacterized protein n=1 Tax=Anguilla anguilla TaxID=7936 RepID=A0A0E9WMK6_ANGAN